MQILFILIALVLPATAAAQNKFFSTTINAPLAGPNVIVTVAPFDGTSVLFSPLAAPIAGGKQESLVALSLKINNQENVAVKLSKVKVSFSGDPQVVSTFYETNFSVAAKKTSTLHFSREQNIRLPFPAPQGINIELTFDGFTPVILSKPLTAHVNALPQSSYLFPAKTSDLNAGEYWSGASGHPGSDQRFAYDMGVVIRNPANGEWVDRKLNKLGSNAKEDYLIWHKPVYAMADGVVVSCTMDQPDNKVGDTVPGGGNNFVIRHGSEKALYAHMSQGTITASLCTVGATVKAGDKLGLAGNSGNSSHPHLHIHVTNLNDEFRPLLLRDIQVINRTEAPFVGIGAAWVSVKGKGLPFGKTTIWPSATKPAKVVNCATLNADLKELESELADLKSQMSEAGPSQKPFIAQQIKATQAKIAAVKADMEKHNCQNM